MPNVSLSLAEYPTVMVRAISIRLKLLPLFAYLFCLCAGALPVLAAAWQEHRDAGLLAFSNADYGDAVQHFERAVGAAEKEGASAQEHGVILQKLTTSYLATGWFRPAQDTISKWDSILQASAGEPWEPQQRLDRDRLALLVSEVLVQREPATRQDTPMQEAEGLPTKGDADVPFQPDEEQSINSAQAVEKRPALSSSSSNYVIHLVSLKNKASVDDSWAILQKSYPELLGDKSLEVTEIDLAEQGTFYRIHAGFFAASADAEATCKKLQLLQQYCRVIDLD